MNACSACIAVSNNHPSVRFHVPSFLCRYSVLIIQGPRYNSKIMANELFYAPKVNLLNRFIEYNKDS